MGKPTGRNENHMLECPWVGESTGLRRLRYLCKQQNPRIVFLMETKLDQKRMERVRRMCGFSSGLEIEAEGSRGGLCLAWKDDIVVTLRSYSKWHIDVLLWEGSIQNDYPWLVAGDFNEILYSFEKSGGVPREQKRMEAFRDILEECKLSDIGYLGVWYTWERGNLPETNIKERLDRGVANEEWLLLFPMGNIQHLTFSSSDHCLIREFWDSSSVPLMEKLKLLQNHLKKWAGSIKSRKDGLKRSLTRELESLLMKDRDDDTMAKIIDTKIHLNLEIDKDEVYWEQRARTNWLKLRDKNTAFFHKCASTRRRINSITKLVSEDGREITDDSEILEAATGYFEDLFASKGNGDPRKVLEGIESIISHEVNESLLSPFREDEVRTALKDMGPTKAPGLDGLPALFFQQYWHIMGKEVLDFCLGILNGNKVVDLANVTEIMLIPKTLNPSSLVNFRPISLCSVLYKIVAKTIANKMQNVIGLCIDEVQSAFVPGHLIIDNVLLAYDILHTFRQKRTGKKGYMTVKLDMSKAYDRVEWNFVKEMMPKMGFAHEWMGLIMKCITSVSYAVNINGYRGRVFQPTRGLRQGDPLSPFLFLICNKGLSSLMRVANQAGLVKGARVSRRGPEVSHLLFADDCMMFGEATEQGARNLKDILEEYENCSGQCVNFNKSTIFYSSNTSADAKETVSLLGVRSSSNPEKYLGLPNVVGRRKKEAFKSILDKISLAKEEGGLGFRNMAQFNVALLAKQGWRMLIKPDSLVARVFKAKYFPDYSFHDSNLGSSSSYVWRSIWAAKASLEMGLIWRVGTGENIFVFEDAWIPNFTNVRLTSDFGNLQFVKVAELIKSDMREWNKELISNTFLEAEAEMIFRIPLATVPHDDLLVWKGELSGEESMNHLFRECPASVTIWKELSNAILVTFPFTEFVEWLTRVMILLPLSVCRLF
ncbi:reverse transcriptase [Gossypium australe]|uniref:Reverse transcriptase n=1 Tax=Gossypium australe TaxID=47621 RepID=A0A5B6UC75_9ROSI|nr:reverse transcriptase [Gossypium australe]